MTGDEWVSQTGPRRIVVRGWLIPAGGVCTVMFLQAAHGWVLHPFGLDQGAVGLTRADGLVIAEGLSAA